MRRSFGCLAILVLGLLALLLVVALPLTFYRSECQSQRGFVITTGNNAGQWRIAPQAESPFAVQGNADDLADLILTGAALLIVGLPVLVGLIIGFVALMVRRRSAPQRQALQAEDAELLRAMHQGLMGLNRRLEALEIILLDEESRDQDCNPGERE